MSLHGMGHFVVAVRFDGSDRTYDYLCQFDDVAVGDRVVVRSRGREAETTVVEIKPDSDKATANIVRKVAATPGDAERKGDPF